MKTRLQELRKKVKSAREFAEHIGMNPHTYTEYEQGRMNFTLERAWEFADALGCSLDELAGRKAPINDTTGHRTSYLASLYERCEDGRRDTLIKTAESFAELDSLRQKGAR